MSSMDIFKVCETTHFNIRTNSGYSGIMYFASYEKALNEFYERVDRLKRLSNNQGKLECEGSHDRYYTIKSLDGKITYEFRLERHDMEI